MKVAKHKVHYTPWATYPDTVGPAPHYIRPGAYATTNPLDVTCKCCRRLLHREALRHVDEGRA